jgi:hypothetical protein
MIRVYRFGLLQPTENADVVREQMWLAHKYRNTLTEIERGRRAATRLLHSSVGDIPALEADVEKAEEEHRGALDVILRHRAKTRSRSETPEMKGLEKEARRKRSIARKALSDARRLLREDASVRAEEGIIHSKKNELVRSARDYSGLGHNGPHRGAWGTYLLVESAADQAAHKPLYRGADASDPHFVRAGDVRRFRVGVQLQGGLPIADALAGADSQLRLASVEDRAWLDRSGGAKRPPHHGKRTHMRTTLRMRVGSESRTKPIWATWPMIMHRPIPDGAIIKMVTVAVERIGPRECWYACFTVDLPARRATCGTGRIAMPVGWRTRPAGALRVAVLVDDRGGQPSEVTLDSEWISSLDKADELRRTRDTNFNAARDALNVWLTDRTDLPDWLLEARPHLWQWRSAGRLAALAKRWRNNRFVGDEDSYVALETWRYKDRHLWEWESSQRSKTLLRRREQYRKLAAHLAKEYGEVLLADTDKRVLAKRGGVDVTENDTARLNRVRAAVSELEGAVRNAFLAAGGIITKVDVSSGGGESGAGATHECHLCGFPNEFDAALSVEQHCDGCDAMWDQDANMAKNMLKRRERIGDAPSPGTARDGDNANDSGDKYEGRFAKARRKKAEKTAAAGTARKADDDAAE